MKANPFARLLRVGNACLVQPGHFFRLLEREIAAQHWSSRLPLMQQVREISLTDLVPDRNISLDTVTFRSGGSSVPDYLLLAGLCRLYAACHYFEIGTFLGESIANVAPYCKHCVSLSLSEEEFVPTDEVREQARKVSRMFSKPLANVEHLYGDSMKYDFKSIREKFDVIFVDGCHDYPFVVSDTANAFQLMRDDDSVMVFHDVKNAYNEIESEVMAGILDGLPREMHPHLYTVENTLCAVLTRKPQKSFERASLKTNLYAKPKLKFRLSGLIEELNP